MLDECKFTSGSVILLHPQHEQNIKTNVDILDSGFASRHHLHRLQSSQWTETDSSKQAESKVLSVNFSSCKCLSGWFVQTESLYWAQSGYNPTPTAAASSEKAPLVLMKRTQTHMFTEVKKKNADKPDKLKLDEVWSTLMRFPVVIFCCVSQRSWPHTDSKDNITEMTQGPEVHVSDVGGRHINCLLIMTPPSPPVHHPPPSPTPFTPSLSREGWAPAVRCFQLLWQHFFTLGITPAEMKILPLDDGHANMCVDKSAAVASHGAAV